MVAVRDDTMMLEQWLTEGRATTPKQLYTMIFEINVVVRSLCMLQALFRESEQEY